MPPRAGRLRPLAHVASGLLESALAWLLLAPALSVIALGAARLRQDGVDLGAVTALASGVALTGLVALAVARPVACAARRRLLPGSRPTRWLDARSLAWLAVTLTVRSAVLAWGVLVATLAGVGLIAPALVARGDRVDVGPWRVDAMPAAVALALAALVLLVTGLLSAPALARADRTLARSVLVGEEAELEHELAETATSRARIVDAHDQERRRIERDLHDGVQPEILGVSMTLGLALATMRADDPARALVARAQQQSLDALENLRRFVRGVHPQVLDDHGLAAALGELADTLPTPVDVDSRLTQRLPRPVEANLYYAAAELLTNVAKHAGASRASVVIEHGAQIARVTVTDDGRGGADPSGRGLTGVQDRLAAIGGRLTLDSPAGGPTRATIETPVQQEPCSQGES